MSNHIHPTEAHIFFFLGPSSAAKKQPQTGFHQNWFNISYEHQSHTTSKSYSSSAVGDAFFYGRKAPWLFASAAAAAAAAATSTSPVAFKAHFLVHFLPISQKTLEFIFMNSITRPAPAAWIRTQRRTGGLRRMAKRLLQCQATHWMWARAVVGLWFFTSNSLLQSIADEMEAPIGLNVRNNAQLFEYVNRFPHCIFVTSCAGTLLCTGSTWAQSRSVLSWLSLPFSRTACWVSLVAPRLQLGAGVPGVFKSSLFV